MAQQGGDGDSASTYFLVGIVLAIAIVAAFPLYSDALLAIWRYLRIGELWFLSWIPDWVPYLGKVPVDDAYLCLTRIEECLGSDGLNTTVATTIDRLVMAKFSWIPGIFFIVIGVLHLRRQEHVGAKHNMETLLKQNAAIYPHAAPFVEAHPERADLLWDPRQPETAEFGASISPERFARMSPPLGLSAMAKKNSAFRQPIWDGNTEFDVDLAERAFACQLGARFTGIENLDETATTVFNQLMKGLTFSQQSVRPIIENAFSKKPNLTMEGDRRIAAALKEKFKEKGLPKLDRMLLKSLVQDKALEPLFRYALAERTMYQHGFVITGLMSLLHEARQGGVVAGCELLWVKRKNRTYWYALNSVGRKVAFCEAGGAFAHWLIECHLGRPLTHPEVGEAIKGLEIALQLNARRERAQEAAV